MKARVLFIGGLDSSGGAGLLRDMAVAADLGAQATVAATAVTAQTDGAVTSVHPVPPAVLHAQIIAAGSVGAVKIGMLGTADSVRAVARALPEAPLILDPVLAASSGRSLLEDAGVEALIRLLLPRTALLTPNLPELHALARHLRLPDHLPEPAIIRNLLASGCQAVLVKGGHGADPAVCEDRLYQPDHPPIRFRGPRHPHSLRGTGCHLASAIAVHFSKEIAIVQAIEHARDHLGRRFLFWEHVPCSATESELLPDLWTDFRLI